MRLSYNENKKSYYVSNGKQFIGEVINEPELQKVLDFAYEMSFGNGHHRNHRTGGQYGRRNGEKFCNAFQGKLAEVVLFNLFKQNNLKSSEPDFGIYGEGIWDDTDLVVAGKKINVKSVADVSNLLLLETKDWNLQGQYIPNINNGTTSLYDYFILLRIRPDIKKIFKSNKIFFSDELAKSVIENLLYANQWSYDIAGYCTNAQVIEAIAKKMILPQNSTLNSYTKMDAENYYIQCGDMGLIKDLIDLLKSTE